MTKSPKNPMLDQYWYTGGICGLIARATLRTLQFTLAIIIAALYGIDLANASRTHAKAQTEWVYAEVVATLSAITCIIHCFVTVKRVGWATWDAVLFVLWLAQVGVFGGIYVSPDVKPEYEKATGSLDRIRAAVWFGLVNMLLWFGTMVLGLAWCIRARRVTRKTDKADNGKVQDLEREIGKQEIGYEKIEEKKAASESNDDDERSDEKCDMKKY